MILTIHDFPLKIENNYLKNCKNEIILNFSNITKEILINFIFENISAINDGKRIYKKRLTKTLSLYNKEEAINIIKTEMFEKGYIINSSNNNNKIKNNEVEYTIIFKEGKTKIYFNKIISNMDNVEKIRENLYNILKRTIDAEKEENLTSKNKKAVLKDLIQFLNYYYNNIIQNKEVSIKGLFNKHQEIWFWVINKLNKEIKYPYINITSGLFRCYIITIFKSKGEEKLLKEITGWNFIMLKKENLTYDMKIILLSVNEILNRSNNKNNKE